MITGKHFNILTVALVAAVLLFTSIFMYSSTTLGIQKTSTEPDYAKKLFDQEKVSSIKITADHDKWEEMLKNATAEQYIPCDITINGETYKSVGIRPKGNSSLSMVANSDSERFSFKIKMDEYVKGQNYHGLSKFVINNMLGDATYMKEYLSYDLFKYMGVETPLYAFADISVNDKAWGLYLAVEAVEKDFLQRTYGSDYGELYKPETPDMGQGGFGNDKQVAIKGNAQMQGGMQPPADMPMPDNIYPGVDTELSSQIPQGQVDVNGSAKGNMPGMPSGMKGMEGETGGGADLVYTDSSLDSYNQIFDNKITEASTVDKKDLLEALKALSTGENLDKYVDVDEVLSYFAVNTTLVNLDSYISNFKHNYYLYQEDGKISILPWDLNLSFAGFQANSASSAVNFPIDTPVVEGVNLDERPLIGTLLKDEEYLQTYHNKLIEIVNGYFNSGRFEQTIGQLDKLIGEYVKKDQTAFYSYEDYVKGVKALKEFGKLRAESIKGQVDGTVPSTYEEQSKDAGQLIDASTVNLSDMGTQGFGKGGDKGLPEDFGK